MKTKIPWLRIAAESVAIVASILLAFAIQAWWEGRGEAGRRQAILLGLQSDFEVSDSVLVERMSMDSVRMNAAARLFTLGREGRDLAAFQATVDTLLSHAYYSGVFSPATGTLDALLSTGSLDILDNPGLVAQLTSFQVGVEDLRMRQNNSGDHISESFDPYLVRHGVNTGDLVWTSFESGFDLPWEPRHTDAYRLVGTPEFQSIVSTMWFAASDALTAGAKVRGQIETIQLLIETELGRLGLSTAQ